MSSPVATGISLPRAGPTGPTAQTEQCRCDEISVGSYRKQILLWSLERSAGVGGPPSAVLSYEESVSVQGLNGGAWEGGEKQ